MWELIASKIDNFKLNSYDKERWLMIIESIKLTQEQKEFALKIRSEYIGKLEKLYINRQNLNLKTIGLLLPSEQGGQLPTMGQIGCFSVTSFFHRAKHSSKTKFALEQLRRNLNEEQKLITEFEYLVFYKVLNLIQAAWCVIGAYPHHCDCLELLNAIHELYHTPAVHES